MVDRPEGHFIHNDYMGPQRNQYSKRQWRANYRN